MESSPVTDLPATAQRGRRSPASRTATGRDGRSAVAAIGIAATRRCSRADCNEPATSTLVFSYDEQVARLGELLDEREPQAYDLCSLHADRTSPPLGWEIADSRPRNPTTPRRVDDEDTVAVIAAALRGDDAPRRVDVIDGGDGTAPPRRVTATTVAEPPSPAADRGEDPLRAALEELQRVVPTGTDEGASAPLPLTRRRRDGLPSPPPAPPPGPPPATRPDEDRPTLW